MSKLKYSIPKGVTKWEYGRFIVDIGKAEHKIEQHKKNIVQLAVSETGEAGLEARRGEINAGRWFLSTGAVAGDPRTNTVRWNLFHGCKTFDEALEKAAEFYNPDEVRLRRSVEWERKKYDKLFERLSETNKKLALTESERDVAKYFETKWEAIARELDETIEDGCGRRLIEILIDKVRDKPRQEDGFPIAAAPAPDALITDDSDVARAINLLIVDSGVLPPK